ncbi:SNF2 domain-containing protein CLASSY 1-like [Curcuma longa]|uniref:SNF2 domain-containing protein CLASSY 1-like n=1 Tax=Curcuma longa TaxID=136217 RepID=UPI003D9EF597
MWKMHICNHPIDGTPFEALYNGSWHGVDHISIKNGSTFAKINYNGSMVLDKVDGDCLRMRSRKASSSDCSHLLKPGTDVCALSGQVSLWHDAKIITIKKTLHDDYCTCLFNVMFFTNKTTTSEKNHTNNRWAEVVPIENISILQKVQSEPWGDGCYKWNSTVDCVSNNKSKLLNDTVSSEVAWMLVLSTLKGMSFDLKLVKDNLVYFIHKMQEDSTDLNNMQSEGAIDTTPHPTSHKRIKALHFQISNKILRPKIVTLLMEASEEMPPKKTSEKMPPSGVESFKDDEGSDSEVEILYQKSSLRHSKRLKTAPDRFSSYSSPNFNRPAKKILLQDTNKGELQPYIPFTFEYLMDEDPASVVLGEKKSLEEKTTMLHSQHSSIASKVKLIGFHKRGQPRSKILNSDEIDHMMPRIYKESESSKKTANIDDIDLIMPRLYKERVNCKKAANPTECKDAMEKCMGTIRRQIEGQFESIVREEANQPTTFNKEDEDFNWTPLANTPVEKDEHEDLWKEMEHCLTSIALTDQKQAMDMESPYEDAHDSVEDGEEKCQHDFKLDEEIGLTCRLCHVVCTERKYVFQSFLKCNDWVSFKEKFDAQKLDWVEKLDMDLNSTRDPISLRENLLSETCENVWNLIDDLQSKLHLHQKKAFEFIWRNAAGSLVPSEMMQLPEKTGGCVISHSPGSGKTLLIIAFIVSFLRLFPRSRPLVLAPKSAIHTWRKEFQKWEIPVPVHLIQRDRSYEKEILFYKYKLLSRRTRMPNRKMMKIMDMLEKLRQWHENPSILMMNYSSFFSLAKQDSKLEYVRFMAEVLLKSPGILILDEGHNPRSTNSKLRKLLMEVKTENRILLSGTVFQNNFEEYFNTLALARPSFVDEVVNELDLDPHRRKLNREKKKHRKERLARKLFVEKIGQSIESSQEHDRKQGFELLNKMTSRFVDVYGNEILGTLPGLEIYTIMLASTDLQQKMLSKLQKSITHKRYPIEVELLITVCTIHPWLVTTVNCVSTYFNAEELTIIQKCRENLGIGSKAKFLIDLVHKSNIRGEKVLVFCHNISPLNFFVDMFKLIFGWNKGEEILVLQGDQELPVRARIMDKFNGDTDGKCKVLLASTTACAEGISLTAASRLVMLDSEWNHSKTRQAIARAFRPGQDKVVYVYLLLASGTWEESKSRSNARKAWMSKMIFLGRYIEFSSSKQVEHIDDELLHEMVEEDESKSLQIILRPD